MARLFNAFNALGIGNAARQNAMDDYNKRAQTLSYLGQAANMWQNQLDKQQARDWALSDHDRDRSEALADMKTKRGYDVEDRDIQLQNNRDLAYLNASMNYLGVKASSYPQAFPTHAQEDYMNNINSQAMQILEAYKKGDAQQGDTNGVQLGTNFYNRKFDPFFETFGLYGQPQATEQTTEQPQTTEQSQATEQPPNAMYYYEDIDSLFDKTLDKGKISPKDFQKLEEQMVRTNAMDTIKGDPKLAYKWQKIKESQSGTRTERGATHGGNETTITKEDNERKLAAEREAKRIAGIEAQLKEGYNGKGQYPNLTEKDIKKLWNKRSNKPMLRKKYKEQLKKMGLK